MRSVARFALVAPIALSACDRTKPPAPSTSASAATQPVAPQPAAQATQDDKQAPAAGPSVPPPPDLTSPPAGAKRAPSGVLSVVLQRGEGATRPAEFDRVRFQLATWASTGETLAAGEVAQNRLSQVPYPWLLESLRLMVAGEKRRLWIPAALGAGAAENPVDLVADVQLEAIEPAFPPPPAPRAATMGVDASRSRTGIAYTIYPSHRADAPVADPLSMVVLNYTVWESNGHLVDSTALDARPVSVPVWHLDRQWGEAVSLVKKGDRIRFSFQEPMAGGAAKTLVAELDLLDTYRPH